MWLLIIRIIGGRSTEANDTHTRRVYQKVFLAYITQTLCKIVIMVFWVALEAKLKLLRETSSESIGKVEKKPFTQMSLLQNRNLHRIAVFDQRGPPAWYLGGSQSLSSSIN
jgi:hypothetical protein